MFEFLDGGWEGCGFLLERGEGRRGGDALCRCGREGGFADLDS